MSDPKRTLFLSLVFLVMGGGWIAFDYFQRKEAPKDSSPLSNEQQPAFEQKKADQEQTYISAKEQLEVIETEQFRATFSSLSGGLKSYELKGQRFTDDKGAPINMVTTDKPQYAMLKTDLVESAESVTNQPWEFSRPNGDSSLQMQKRVGPFKIVQEVLAGQGPYQLLFNVNIQNTALGSEKFSLQYSTYHYVSRDEEGGGFFARPSPEISHGFCYSQGTIERLDREDLLETYQSFSDVRFAGIENNYFVTVISSHGEASASQCFVRTTNRGGNAENPHGALFEAVLHYDSIALDANAIWKNQTLMYVGPKEITAIRQAGSEIEEVVDLGWFSWIGKYLLQLLRWIYSGVGNWGFAIILLTLLVKLILFPLTEKSFRSMAKMRLLKPELDKINKQFADDREQKTAAVMEVYRKQKINPFGGCLPTLMQLPIWFALYQSLSTNVELYHAPFALWWTDLSSPDPYFVLPVCLGLLMFLQQKITPTTAMDPTQAKMMMYFMPLMITSFMLFLPAGLCLYMVTNSSLSLAQQKFIHWRLDQETDKNSIDADTSEQQKTAPKLSSKNKGQKK